MSQDPKAPLSVTPEEGQEGRMLELAERYRVLGQGDALHWTSNYQGLQLVGRGGQGVVYRCHRVGTDNFELPVALKVFSPEVYSRVDDYELDMQRVASVAMRVAQLQNHQLLDIHNFIERDRIRVMVMEWVNGYDLHHLLSPKTFEALHARSHLLGARWTHLSDVVITDGPQQARLKPGIAIEILRGCLTGLASLHRAGVAHGDIKPANIMLNRTGSLKLVDFGSAVDLRVPQSRGGWTRTYAAPEILDGAMNSPQSDLASLGYVLIEMLSGRVLFDQGDSVEKLHATKRGLPARLPGILPPDVVRNRDLMDLCRAFVEPDPGRRIASAEEANIVRAAKLHRQLVKTDLDSEYENDLRVWMECLPSGGGELMPVPPGPEAPSVDWSALADQSTILAGTQ